MLNLAEGSGRASSKDQKRFFSIALGSLRESLAIIDLAEDPNTAALEVADKLGAHIYRLINRKG